MTAPVSIIGADRVPTGRGWSYEARVWVLVFLCGKFQCEGWFL
jgi:hypothetical protein